MAAVDGVPAAAPLEQPIPNEFREEWAGKIREAFNLFDKERKGVVIVEEVGTIMRYIGAYPSERGLVSEILPAMQGDEPTSFVTYDKFEHEMLKVLFRKKWEPDSESMLLDAFRVIDADGKGFVSADELRELLVQEGTPFRAKEIEAFMNVAKDSEFNRVYYEDYIAMLLL
uniref:EF-hand domain-containing protein n=1 Tax=Phaeomonas parva TaxID=124430 RepID=A0A7S1XRS0_9STRA|mmetsp:Transcript_27212/g.85654  ORF Transcript_27212/g.85654 Transcript_27212/m.85654 type:complete len:171 (+) Transcript_27212:145-657(+)